MLKKLISAVMAVSMAASLLVLPAEAAGFSSANYTHYSHGFGMAKSDGGSTGKLTFKETLTDDVRTGVYCFANSSTSGSTYASTSDVNPINTSSKAADDATYTAKYAHQRFYLAAFTDGSHTSMNTIQIRIDKDGSGSSRDEFLLKRTSASGSGTFDITKGSCGSQYFKRADHGWSFGNGPSGSTAAADCHSDSTRPSDSDYHKFDIIVDMGAVKKGTIYLFVDDLLRFVVNESDSSTNSNGHYHGIVLRLPKNYHTRNKSDYISAKFDIDRTGFREYYDTSDYKVTFEDVLQDAGLGKATNDPTVIYQTPNMKSYIASTADGVTTVVKKNNDVSDTSTDINPQREITLNAGTEQEETVTYDSVVYDGDNKVVITHKSDDTGNWKEAARLLAGGLLQRVGHGLSYVGYAARAKYIKFSFDQTINSGTATWVGWELYNQQSTGTPSVQIWNNGGNLVIGGMKNNISDASSSNKTIKTAPFNDKAHIDWIVDPVAKVGYVYVNGDYVGCRTISTDRILEFQISTKGVADSQVTLENWSMTMYNSDKTIRAIEADMSGVSLYYPSAPSYEKVGDQLAVTFQANSTANFAPTGNTYVYTALFSKNKRLLDIKKTTYVEGRIVADEDENNIFDISKHPLYTDKKDDNKSVRRIATFIWSDANPQITKSEIWIGN